MREGAETMLKHNPAQIIALEECGRETEKFLRVACVKGDPQLRVNNTDPRLRGGNELKSRVAYEYLALRGQEEPARTAAMTWSCWIGSAGRRANTSAAVAAVVVLGAQVRG